VYVQSVAHTSTGLYLYAMTGSLAFTRAPSRTRSQKTAQLLQYFTDYTLGELDQLGYVRLVGYRIAP